MLDNAPVQLIWLHRLVKLVELSVAPCIGLICGWSLQCLRDVYGMSGRIYRLGGDEFCVILTRNVDRIDQLNAAFACRLQNNRAQLPWLPDVSTGYAVFDTSEEELGNAVERADAEMYRVKNEKKAAARS